MGGNRSDRSRPKAKRNWFGLLPSLALTALLASCSSDSGSRPAVPRLAAAERALAQVRSNCAPDLHLEVFNVGVQLLGARLVLTGEVDRAEARLAALQALAQIGVSPVDGIVVLPTKDLGERAEGLVSLSVGSGRIVPEHKSEMVTQFLMGETLRVLKRSRNWYYVQGHDGYLAWLERGSLVRCTAGELEAWNNSPRLIVTALEEMVLERPETGAQPVSDVVICDLLQQTSEQGDWFGVRLPDGREGFLPKKAAADYTTWRQQRHAAPESLESTARRFLGRPYLWGGVSPKGLDCSGFTRLVYYLNGIDLNRDASQQVRQGHEVPLDGNLAQLKRGDLLFFGRDPAWGGPQRIFHVGLYLGDKRFIHSSERVQINSLDPNSPMRDELRIRTLIRARRILED